MQQDILTGLARALDDSHIFERATGNKPLAWQRLILDGNEKRIAALNTPLSKKSNV